MHCALYKQLVRPVNGPKGSLARALLLPVAKVVRQRTHLAGTRQYIWIASNSRIWIGLRELTVSLYKIQYLYALLSMLGYISVLQTISGPLKVICSYLKSLTYNALITPLVYPSISLFQYKNLVLKFVSNFVQKIPRLPIGLGWFIGFTQILANSCPRSTLNAIIIFIRELLALWCRHKL